MTPQAPSGRNLYICAKAIECGVLLALEGRYPGPCPHALPHLKKGLFIDSNDHTNTECAYSTSVVNLHALCVPVKEEEK